MKPDPGNASILVASEFFLHREGVTALLAQSGDVRVLPPCDPGGLPDRIGADRPAAVVLLLGATLRAQPQLAAAARDVRRLAPDCGLVVIAPAWAALAQALVSHGPRGVAFLPDERVADLDAVLRAVHDVTSGIVAVHSEVGGVLVGRTGGTGFDGLTARELDVLAELALGRSNGGIAEVLSLSVKAVEGNLTSIFRKLGLNGDTGVDRRTAAALTYLGARPLGPSARP